MMLVERRDQQNAADAAALAGARYVLTDEVQAEAAARRSRSRTGSTTPTRVRSSTFTSRRFTDATPSCPASSRSRSRRFVLGLRRVHRSRSMARGRLCRGDEYQNLTFPFSMLALDPTACKAIHVAGSGSSRHTRTSSRTQVGPIACGSRVQPDRWQHIDVIADDATCRPWARSRTRAQWLR